MPTTQQESRLQHIDSDGIPPGLDLELTGKAGYVRFSGHFYATPEVPFTQFSRAVQIIFASKEVFVAYDLQRHNLYAVDRLTNISLGCRMKAEFIEVQPQPA